MGAHTIMLYGVPGEPTSKLERIKLHLPTPINHTQGVMLARRGWIELFLALRGHLI